MTADPVPVMNVATLSEYWRIARRRWPSLVIGMLLGLIAGAGWYIAAPRSYEAHATVTINPITRQLFADTPVNQLVNTATETEIMRSIEVAQRAATIAGLDEDPRDMRDRLTVTVPQSSLALEITFSAGDPDVAADGANAFAASYLEFREEVAEARRARYAEQLRTQVRDLGERIEEAGRGRSSQALLQELTAVRQQLSDATSVPISAGNLVSEALPPRYPTSPRRLPAIAGGVVMGMLLGIAFAAFRHRTDDRIFTPEEASEAAELPVIGTLPALTRRSHLARHEADDVALAAMRLTRPTFNRGIRSWVVLRADLKVGTRADLIAWSLGRSHDVTLVRLGVDDPDGVVHPHWDLSTLAPSPQLSVQSEPLRKSQGYIILDGGGLQGLAEAIGVQGSEAVLVAVELGVTRRRDVQRTVGEIRDLAPELLAPGMLVINKRSWSSRLRGGSRRRTRSRRGGRARPRPPANPTRTLNGDPGTSSLSFDSFRVRT